ncbi:MAG: hypothetical protein AB7F43_03930 [Bacteriovoracia bacterium]
MPDTNSIELKLICLSKAKVFLLVLVFLNFGNRFVFAAPCCAGAGAIPALITDDSKAQGSFTSSYGAVIGDAPDKGIPVFRSKTSSEVTYTNTIELSHIFFERFQGGVSVPVVTRTISKKEKEAAQTGLGDTRVSVGYEAIPEWSYSKLRPKVILFSQATLATGVSIYETKTVFTEDVTGRGFNSIGLGGVVMKTFYSFRNPWDVYFLTEAHKGFLRNFQTIKVDPAWGATAGVGVGKSFMTTYPLRVGLRVQPVYGAGKKIESSYGVTNASYQFNFDIALEAALQINDELKISGTYTDQTLLGPAVNTTLSRTIALMARYSWQR